MCASSCGTTTYSERPPPPPWIPYEYVVAAMILDVMVDTTYDGRELRTQVSGVGFGARAARLVASDDRLTEVASACNKQVCGRGGA